jgi:hypothetical protein
LKEPLLITVAYVLPAITLWSSTFLPRESILRVSNDLQNKHLFHENGTNVVDLAQLSSYHHKTESGSGLQKVVLNKKNMTVDNIQNSDSYINTPSTLAEYFFS